MRRLLATEVASGTTELLRKLKEERGQDDRAAAGLAATAAAVSEARAAVVLVPEEVEGATLWYGSQPVPVATSRQALIDIGGEDPKEGPASEVLIRAALGTGAGIRIVPHPPFPRASVPSCAGEELRWALHGCHGPAVSVRPQVPVALSRRSGRWTRCSCRAAAPVVVRPRAR